MRLSIENGSVTIKGETILENIDFTINSLDHIGITGRNGSGKTTLLKAIIDNSMLEDGYDTLKIEKFGNFKIGYLEQVQINDNKTMFEELISCYSELLNLEKKLNDLENNLTSDKNIMDYSNYLERYKQLGGYTYRINTLTMINKFEFNESDKDKLIGSFSGGERMKISFMKLLLSTPDLLILDEPTNHLDIKTIEWLEGYLKNYKKAFIIVSHDRMFLDNTVNIIYDIEYGETHRYSGNYSYFIEEKQKRFERLEKDYKSQQEEIKRLKAIYERFRFKPSKSAMAMSKLSQIERMDIIEKPRRFDTKVFKTNFKDIESPGRIVLKINDLEFGYNNSLGRINLEVERGSRIGIIGRNGIGKSTLLKTLYGIIPSIKGKIQNGYNVKSAYFDQNLNFETEGTVYEEFSHHYPKLNNLEIRSILGSFMFNGLDVEKKLNVLSGGEKVRLLLAILFYKKPNLLYLDEPTNHLDILGKENLEKLLKSYPETIIFVSHDRYFVKELATSLLVFDDNNVLYFKYGYSEYEEYLKNKKETKIEEKDELENLSKEKDNNIENKNKLSNNEIRRLEKDIINTESKIKKLEEELFKEEVYSDYIKNNQITSEINDLKEKLSILESEYFRDE